MSKKEIVCEILLYLALALVGILMGASVYQRISLIPDWAGSLPDSLVNYFRGTTAAASISRFWTSMVPIAAVGMLLAVVMNFLIKARRLWISLAAVFFFSALIWTAVWFVPQGVIPLMEHGAMGMNALDITERAETWIFLDWFRMGLTFAAFFALVKCATIRPSFTKINKH